MRVLSHAKSSLRSLGNKSNPTGLSANTRNAEGTTGFDLHTDGWAPARAMLGAGRATPRLRQCVLRMWRRLAGKTVCAGIESFSTRRCQRMLIAKHDRSDIVELEDGSRWRIWPGDIAATLQWLPTTELQLVAIDDECCSHALINHEDGRRVRVIAADADWPAELVRQHLRRG